MSEFEGIKLIKAYDAMDTTHEQRGGFSSNDALNQAKQIVEGVLQLVNEGQVSLAEKLKQRRDLITAKQQRNEDAENQSFVGKRPKLESTYVDELVIAGLEASQAKITKAPNHRGK